MRLLLDTHALIWWLAGSPRLSSAARDAVRAAAAGDVLVSAVVGYEITIKHAIGKLPDVAVLARDVAGNVALEGFVVLPVTLAHAEQAGRLPLHHRDPFDRLQAAQALHDDLALVSADRAFDPYGVRRLW